MNIMLLGFERNRIFFIRLFNQTFVFRLEQDDFGVPGESGSRGEPRDAAADNEDVGRRQASCSRAFR